MADKKLYRNEENSMIGGVCNGLADYFGLDVTLVRIIFVILLIGGGSGFLIYLVLWLITPLKGENVDYKKNVKNMSKKTKSMAKEIEKEIKLTKKGHSGGFLGLVLMVFGMLFLLEKIVPIFIHWDYIWPVALIVLGVYLVFRD
jgi:phage shock protein C